MLGTELLRVQGPLSVQSEIMVTGVNQIDGPDAYLWGGYVQAGWFLTGEHRPYDRATASIDRIRPLEDFFRVRDGGSTFSGLGAWEVALRFSHLDLDSANIAGGVLSDTTLGLNWYTNPYCKIVANVIHANLANPIHGRSSTNIFALRAQLDF